MSNGSLDVPDSGIVIFSPPCADTIINCALN
jgi:hypothetical protein